MKLVNIANPVRASWLIEQGHRLDASPFLSGAYEARKLLERLPRTEPLHSLTTGHDGGIFNGPKFRRIYVTDPDHGVPFLGSTDMLEADFSWLPLLRRADAAKLAYLEIQPGMTLISCSGTVGRMTYVRRDMAGFWSSQHVMKVQPDPERIPPGYLNAFLQSAYGVPIVASSAYGAIIQHIEPRHIADLPVPRFDEATEAEIHELIQQAANLRTRFQSGVREATRDLFVSAGLPELVEFAWHKQPRDLGFVVGKVTQVSLRAFNFSPRAGEIIARLRSVPHRTLGEICARGQLGRGNRFKRVNSDPCHGIRLIGQRQGFWLHPDGRWITLSDRDLANVRAAEGAIMIASQGTHGENEVYCRALYVSELWSRDYVFSERFLRVVSGTPDFAGAYLFALLRSEPLFRVLRAMSSGGKQQDIHERLRREIPVPECTRVDRARIAEIVRQAYLDRDEADRREDQALKLLDDAVREAAR